ncbi:MAG: cryptochrome/photolyase family protein [Deinococcales bacterium]
MILVWHRADLRTHDHPALAHAAAQGQVLPCFVFDPKLLERSYSGNNRIQWLIACLRALDSSYQRLGSSLLLAAGAPESELLRLARAHNARAVYALKSLEPIGRERDARVRAALEQAGIEFKLFASDCVHEWGSIKNGSGASYKVFTPFWRAWSALPLPKLEPTPMRLEPHSVEGLEFPEPLCHIALPTAGEQAAQQRLERFIAQVGLFYDTKRDLPSLEGTSRLSLDFHLGTLSVRMAARRAQQAGMTAWVRELCWRDFYRHILADEPRLEHQAFRREWNDFPWRDAPDELEAWRTGNTGYPIVDAGMRQLQQTGWMHNRVRMIVASFLCKHLLIDWQRGAAHFNDLLFDGDLASNNGGWQWSAGCGVDAAPYFRVFNPVTQGEKFDPDAAYIKRYLPEIEALPTKEAHQPWISLRPPKSYADPIVPLGFGRERFLESAKRHLKP